MLTREEAARKVRMTPEYHYDGVYSHTETNIYEVIDQIFDDHGAQLKAKDECIKELECRTYHAEGYISDLHNSPKVKKFYDAKARSIVAMLFWMMKRQKAIYAKRHKELRQHHEQVAYYKSAYDNSKIRFKQAYKMLKDNQ